MKNTINPLDWGLWKGVEICIQLRGYHEEAAHTLPDRRKHSELSHLKRSFSSRTCIPIRHKEQALTPVLLIEESLDVVWRFIYVLVTCDCACAELCSDNCFDMYWVFSWCVWRKFLLICIAWIIGLLSVISNKRINNLNLNFVIE